MISFVLPAKCCHYLKQIDKSFDYEIHYFCLSPPLPKIDKDLS